MSICLKDLPDDTLRKIILCVDEKLIAKIFKLPLFFVPLVFFLELNKLVKPIFEKYLTQHLTTFEVI